MSLREVTYYIATCDFPGCGADADYGDYTAMGDASAATEMAVDADWMTSSDEKRIYCPKHPLVWESDLNEDETAAPTKPYLLLKNDDFNEVILIADVEEKP